MVEPPGSGAGEEQVIGLFLSQIFELMNRVATVTGMIAGVSSIGVLWKMPCDMVA